MITKSITAALLIGAATIATSASATPTFYTDEAAFLAAAPALTIESFESPNAVASTFAVYGPLTVASSGGIFTTTTNFNPTDGTHNLFVNTASLDFYRNSAPFEFTAFGIDVIKDVEEIGDLTFTVDGGNVTIPFDQTGFTSSPVRFLGVVDAAGFNDAILTPTEPGDLFEYDRLQTSSLPPSSTPGVPEPAAWAVMLVGFGIVGGAMRRRSFVAARAA